MHARIASFAVVTLGLAVACGSSPAASPASPGAPGAPGSPGTPGSPGSDPPAGAATGDLTKPGPAASALAAQATAQDLSTCMQNIDPSTKQDCIDCMTGSCSAQMKNAGAQCPAFSNCICNGGAMQTCAPMINDPLCKDAFSAVGACRRQSCTARCPITASAAGGAPSAVPSFNPGAMPKGGPDSCPALKTCCDQVPSQATKSCMGAVAKNNPDACAATLQVMKGMGMCH